MESARAGGRVLYADGCPRSAGPEHLVPAGGDRARSAFLRRARRPWRGCPRGPGPVAQRGAQLGAGGRRAGFLQHHGLLAGLLLLDRLGDLPKDEVTDEIAVVLAGVRERHLHHPTR